MKQFEISVLSAALAVGAAAGWFAAGVRGDGASPSQRGGRRRGRRRYAECASATDTAKNGSRSAPKTEVEVRQKRKFAIDIKRGM